MTAQLEDGHYDAVVLSAEASDGAGALECTITTVEHRRDVVAIVAIKAAVTDESVLLHLRRALVVGGARVHGEMS